MSTSVPLPRASYANAEVFEQELERLFARRFYLGCRADFAAEQRYRSFQLGAYALSCRATSTGPRLFNNVCLHRNCLIDPLGSGERRFRCGYHGWQYDEAGALQQAPLVDGSCISQRQLREYAVSETGGLYFGSLQQADAFDLTEVDGLLAAQGLVFDGEPFYSDSMEHACNWKLLVENVLEGYHLSFVHGKTFGVSGFDSQASMEAGQGATTLWSRTYPNDAKALTSLKYFKGAKPQYLHGYIFPGTFVANTNNLIGFVSHLLPLAADRTLLSWQLFALPALQQLPGNVQAQIKQASALTSREILLEDKALVEACQQGMASVGSEVQLQENEFQLKHFHALYRKHMSQA